MDGRRDRSDAQRERRGGVGVVVAEVRRAREHHAALREQQHHRHPRRRHPDPGEGEERDPGDEQEQHRSRQLRTVPDDGRQAQHPGRPLREGRRHPAAGELVHDHHPDHRGRRGQQERQADQHRGGDQRTRHPGRCPATEPGQEPGQHHHDRDHRPDLDGQGEPQAAAGRHEGAAPHAVGGGREHGQRHEQPQGHEGLQTGLRLGHRDRSPDGVERARRRRGDRPGPPGSQRDQPGVGRSEQDGGHAGHLDPPGVVGQPGQDPQRRERHDHAGRVQEEEVPVGQPSPDERLGRREVDALVVAEQPRQPAAVRQDHGPDRGGEDGRTGHDEQQCPRRRGATPRTLGEGLPVEPHGVLPG